MNRRSFLALASGLLVPQPGRVRAYSFVGGWARKSPRVYRAEDVQIFIGGRLIKAAPDRWIFEEGKPA